MRLASVLAARLAGQPGLAVREPIRDVAASARWIEVESQRTPPPPIQSVGAWHAQGIARERERVFTSQQVGTSFPSVPPAGVVAGEAASALR